MNGGAGLVRTEVVNRLTEHGHEALAGSLNAGLAATTRRGLVEALTGAHVVVDVLSSLSLEDAAVLALFKNLGRKLMQVEADGCRNFSR